MDGPFPNSRQQPQKVSKDKTSNKKIYGKINHKADRVLSPKEVDSVFLLALKVGTTTLPVALATMRHQLLIMYPTHHTSMLHMVQVEP